MSEKLIFENNEKKLIFENQKPDLIFESDKKNLIFDILLPDEVAGIFDLTFDLTFE